MRLRLIGSFLLSYFILIAAAHAALPTPIVKIDADQLPVGPIGTSGIVNQGSLGGNFLSIVSPAPVVQRVAGRMAISFTGQNGLQSDFVAPLTILNQHAWSFATWLYNPELRDEERYLAWTWMPNGYGGAEQGGTNRQTVFGYGYSYTWGAIALNGDTGDQSWGRMPIAKAGVWHHFAVTFAGTPGNLIMYVDGKPVSAKANKWLALGYFRTAPAGVTVPGVYQAPIRVGTGYRSRGGNTFADIQGQAGTLGYNGSMASMYMYDVELSPSDILALAGGTAPTGPYLFDPSFEYNYHGNGGAAIFAPFESDGKPTGASTGWTVGGDTGRMGAWNTTSANFSGQDTGQHVNSGLQMYQYTAGGREALPGNNQFSKYQNWDSRLAMVDGLTIINAEAGSNLYNTTTPPAGYLAFPGLNGLTDSAYWAQPIWGLIPGKNYVAWGYFAPSRHVAGGSGRYTHATIKLDNIYAVHNEKVFHRTTDINRVTPFQRVMGSFTVPSTGLRTFAVGYEGQGRALVNYTSGTGTNAITFQETNMFNCSAVGVAEEGSAPKPNLIFNPVATGQDYSGPISMYGEKDIFFGPVPTGSSKSITLTLANEGGSDMLITDISFSGPGADQFMASINNQPTPDAPITIPAYGGYKSLSFNFGPTRNGFFQPNLNIQAKYADFNTGEDRAMMPYSVKCTGYSKQMIWNNSFEFPHNAWGEGNGIYPAASLGWTYTQLRTGDGDCHWGIAPRGTWATWGGTGAALPSIGSDMEMVDGTQMAFIRKAGKITQLVPGFNAGRSYQFVFWVAATRESWGFPAWSATLRHPTDTAKDFRLVNSNVIRNRTGNWWEWTGMTFTRFDGARFTPTASSAYTLEIKNDEATDNGNNQIFAIDCVKLYQVGSAAVAYCPTKSLWFGDVQKDDLNTSLPLTIYNDGGSTLTVNGITFTGANASEFAMFDLQGNPINPAFTIPPFYMTTTTLVRLKGTSEGFKCGTVTISTGNQYVSTGVISVDLGGNVPLAPAVANGSFEKKVPDTRDMSRFRNFDPIPLNPAGNNQGYNGLNDSATINNPEGWKGYIGWSGPWVGGVGHNDVFIPGARTGGNWDNGLADGTFVYEIRKAAADPAKSVWQKVPGFRSGRNYHISAKFNSPVGKSATAFLKFDGTEVASGSVAAVAAANNYDVPFTVLSYDYTPTADSAHMVEVGIKGGDGDLLIDDVRVEEVNAKVSVSDTNLRFPDLVVQKQDGSNYSWYYQPTKAYLTITNVGYGTSLNFSTVPADTNTGFPGLKFTGDSAFKINKIRNKAGAEITSISSLTVGDAIELELIFDPAHGTTTEQTAYHTLGSLAGSLVISTNDPNYPKVTVTLNANKVPVEMGSFNVD